MGTWNVAGFAEDEIDLFITQLSDHHNWDFVCLQEAFCRTEDIEFEGGHVMFTCDSRLGGLRIPAILVHERWVSSSRLLASGERWLAVGIGEDLVLLSVHLPHRNLNFSDYAACLTEVLTFLSDMGSRSLILGLDANTCVHSIVDHFHIGGSVTPGFSDSLECERALFFLEFLSSAGFYLANTFMEDGQSQYHTRIGWSAPSVRSQIDFIGLSLNLHCADTGVDREMSYSSDHQYVWAALVNQKRPPYHQKRFAPRNWMPSDSWTDASENISWNWSDWDSMATTWNAEAKLHSQRAPSERDERLAELLRAHEVAEPDERRVLNRTMWRHRRAKRRLDAKRRVLKAAQQGCFPKTKKKSIVVNWQRLFGEADQATALRAYFSDIYSLSDEDLMFDQHIKQHFIDTWRSLRTDLNPRRVSVPALKKAINKLKNGKGSPDGCNAEMFKHLPHTALQSLALFFTIILSELSFPDSWTLVLAILIPKTVGAASLSKFRAIACLPAARKLLGYLWMQFLPELRFESFQCGFIPGAHASNGVYTVNRICELSREWGKPVFLAQLDLRKAFDRVRHSAVIDALKLQGVSLQCLAVICALLGQSQAMMSLGHLHAQPLQLHRGLPQGAPESPILFTLVIEMVLRSLLRKWKSEDLGWLCDALYVTSICYADDVILVSRSKEGLEAMLHDVIDAFAKVGLEVSTEKCHWTSYPPHRKERLRFGTDLVGWESSMTFVGTIIQPGGNDSAAIMHRLSQATKAFYKWQPMLQCPGASIKCRVELGVKTFLSALFWLCETWNPTKAQVKRVNSWGARMFARILCVKRFVAEDPLEYWRRLHRIGHSTLALHGGSIDFRRRQQLHSFAGHVSRADDGIPSIALRTRSLAWWRHFQQVGAFKHPARFRAWRWEQQLVSYYGKAKSPFIDENVGWLEKAQDRVFWRTQRDLFAKAA